MTDYIKATTSGLILLCLSSCTLFKDTWQPVKPSPPAIYSQTTPSKPVPPPLPAKAAIDDEVPPGPLEVTIEEAVLLAMENNLALRVERLTPEIQQTFVEQERAIFDPVLSAGVSAGEARRIVPGESEAIRERTSRGSVAVTDFLPTGTRIDLSAASDRIGGNIIDDLYTTRAELSVTQALLQGRGVAVNLASLRQARLDTLLSEYEFRGFAEALVAQVENTYWEYVLALRQVQIVEESMSLAQQQIEETRHRIRVGALAEIELAAAEAEMALRQEALINARSRVDSLQVQLLRLILPQTLTSVQRELIPRSTPIVPPIPLETLEDHIAVAFQMRPELNQAELLIQRGDLEIVKTKNGLLPRMDMFVSLGRTSYAESFARSFRRGDDHRYDALVGLEFLYPIANRDARARHRRALLTREQRDDSLFNLRDLVRQDVELGFIEVMRTRRQVDATAITRQFQEESLRAETAKFRVGRSTALLVAQVQRDLLVSQVAEVQAITNYLIARTNFYRLEGSLLERRGLTAPGRQSAPPDHE